MRNLVEEAFSYNYLILQLHGILPFKNYEKYHKITFIVIFLTVIVPLPLLSFASFFLEENDMDSILQSAFVASQYFVNIWKYLIFFINRSKTLSLINSLNDPIFSNSYKPRQECIIDDGILVSKRCFLTIMGHALAASPPFIIYPIILKTGRTPLQLWTPFEKPVGSIPFILAYIYVVIGGCMGGYALSSFDTLVASLMYQMTCQVKILKDNLLNLEEDANQELLEKYGKSPEENRSLKNQIIYKNIQKCVQHHERIIEFVDDYVNYFSLSTFLQFLGSGLVICASVYVLSIMQTVLSFTFMFSFIYTMAMFLLMFLYCFFGTTLWEESNTISTAIYMGKWYKYDIRSRKSLMILMERSNKPLIVTAGGIVELSLDSYTVVLKRAYSFYAVLTRYKN